MQDVQDPEPAAAASKKTQSEQALSGRRVNAGERGEAVEHQTRRFAS
jgi:hypothetical protein